MTLSLAPIPLPLIAPLRAVTEGDLYLPHLLAVMVAKSDELAQCLSAPAVACTIILRDVTADQRRDVVSDDVTPRLMIELHEFAHDNRLGKFNAALVAHFPDARAFSFRLDYGFSYSECGDEYRLGPLSNACTIWYSAVKHDPGALVLPAPRWTSAMFMPALVRG